MHRKRKIMVSADSKVQELIKIAYKKSTVVAKNLRHSIELLDIRLASIASAIQIIQSEEKVNNTNKLETANEAWNIMLDYFINNSDAARAFWDTDERLHKLQQMIDFCEETYSKLDKVSQESLNLWKKIIPKKLLAPIISEPVKKPTVQDRKDIFPSVSKKAKKIDNRESSKKEGSKISQKQKTSKKIKKPQAPKLDKVEFIKKTTNKIIFSGHLDESEINSVIEILPKIKQLQFKRVHNNLFTLYQYILKKKHHKYKFQGNYKNVLTELQRFIIGEIPEEKQLQIFNQLVADIQAKESTLGDDQKVEKIDVNITMPTVAMLLHPSHADFYGKEATSVDGDSSRRLIHGLKGIKTIIDRGGLKYKLVTVTDPQSAEKVLLQDKENDDKKNEVLTSKAESLSLVMLHEISKELNMPLTADMHGDILVNDKTLQAVLDSADLAQKAVQQSKENKAPSIAILRPPGHHSGVMDIKQLSDLKKAEGFCFINNVFMGAQTAASLDAKNILIIDFDTHDGNGTKKLLTHSWDQDSNIYFVNTYSQHLYPHQHEPAQKFSESESKTKTYDTHVKIFDRPFPKAKLPVGDEKVIKTIEECLIELKLKNIDTVLVSCGVDAHQDDPLGQGKGRGIALSDNFYKDMIAKVQQHFPNATLSIFLEGGYNVKVIERTFENILKYFENKSKLESTASVLPVSIFPPKLSEEDTQKKQNPEVVNKIV